MANRGFVTRPQKGSTSDSTTAASNNGRPQSYVTSFTSPHNAHLSKAAGECTKFEPPNTAEFDGPRNGRIGGVRPRGRTGPHTAVVAPSALPPAGSDLSAVLAAVLLPILANIAGNIPSAKRARSPSPTPGLQATPCTPRTPKRTRRMSIPLLPVPLKGKEIPACLNAFLLEKGVDLTMCEDALYALDFTPDIIPTIAVSHLCEVTGAVEGQSIKFQAFCAAWSKRLDAARAMCDQE
jgi:hypothetical protein